MSRRRRQKLRDKVLELPPERSGMNCERAVSRSFLTFGPVASLEVTQGGNRASNRQYASLNLRALCGTCARVTLRYLIPSICSRAASYFVEVSASLTAFLVLAAFVPAQQNPASPAPTQQSTLEPTLPSQAPPPAQLHTSGLPAGTDETTEGATVSAGGFVRTSDGFPVPGATLRLVN